MIAKAGKPYARLVPLAPEAPEKPFRGTAGGWPALGNIPDKV